LAVEYSAELNHARQRAAFTESLGERCPRFGLREKKIAGFRLLRALDRFAIRVFLLPSQRRIWCIAAIIVPIENRKGLHEFVLT
jgi:hypothetical protein